MQEYEFIEEEQSADNEFITIAKAQALLAEKHKVIVDDQDGLLLMVTLHQAFLNDHSKLLSAHSQELKALEYQAQKKSEEKIIALEGTVDIMLNDFHSEKLEPLIKKIEEIQNRQGSPGQKMSPLTFGLICFCCFLLLIIALKAVGLF